MRRLWRVAGPVIATGLMAYFLWFAWNNLELHLLATKLQQPGTLLALFLATLGYMTIYPVTGLAWRQLLLRQGQDHSATELTQLIGIAQLAKYIPGNIAQHAGRAALALKRGIPLQPYVASVIQETLLASAASVIIGTLLLAFSVPDPGLIEYRWMLLLLLAGSIGGILLFSINPPLSKSRVLHARLIRMFGELPGPTVTLKVLAAYSCNYLMIGLGVWLIALSLGFADDIDYPLATAAFALSWILGFLAPGAPAGLGAREGIMTLVLQGHGSSHQVVQLVLLSRAASMCGDLISFVIAFLSASLTTLKPSAPQ